MSVPPSEKSIPSSSAATVVTDRESELETPGAGTGELTSASDAVEQSLTAPVADLPSFDPAAYATATDVLEALADHHRLLSALDDDLRQRLLIAAGKISRPEKHKRRALAKAMQRKRKDEKRAADDAVLDSTGIRSLRRAPVFETPLAFAPELPPAEMYAPAVVVNEARNCYVCKADFFELHHFYDQMCGPCAELNWQKRTQRADLRGRVALVTGARVKIGYQASILLLRSGAHVIVTTRFPRDAAKRYAAEGDFAEWKDRLSIYGLDLRHTPSVESFANHIVETFPRLDFIINNACQTVRRPSGYYAHMIETETAPHLALPELVASEGLLAPNAAGIWSSATLSQVPLLPEDLESGNHLFPSGHLDQDLQQVDLRGRNSWRLTLAEVSTVELFEVQLVNAIAPFVLNARLKPLMLKVPSRDKHIVNVSAMEGQFYRRFKTDKHPHTNMAKAALNMMTRTAAVDYVKDGIHMNSVDTGWVTDEDPLTIAERKREEHRFHPPLDIVDGAARIVDPIISGFNEGVHVWGQFLKDYRSTDW